MASSSSTSLYWLNRWKRFLVLTMPTMSSGCPSHTGMRVCAVSRQIARISSGEACSESVTTFSRGTMTSRTRLPLRRKTLRTYSACSVGHHAGLGGLFDQHAQLLDRVDLLVGARRRQPQQADDQVAAPADRPDERAEDAREGEQRPGHEQRHVLGPVERVHLGHLLAQHHVQVGEQQVGERDRHGVGGHQPPGMRQAAEQRLEQVRQRGLAHPAQRQAREGDPHLGGGDGVVQALDRLLHRLRPEAATLDQLLDPRPAHRDQRELRRHEEGVERDQHEDADQEERVDAGRGSWSGSPGGRRAGPTRARAGPRAPGPA